MNLSFLPQNWNLYAVCAVLVAALLGLQAEIKNLERELRSLRLSYSATAAAIAKLERDLFAKQAADRNAAAAAAAEQDAARRRNIDQGLNALPTGNFRSPVYWNAAPSPGKLTN